MNVTRALVAYIMVVLRKYKFFFHSLALQYRLSVPFTVFLFLSSSSPTDNYQQPNDKRHPAEIK